MQLDVRFKCQSWKIISRLILSTLQLLDGQDSIIKSEQSITPSLQMQIGITQQEIDKGVSFQDAITKVKFTNNFVILRVYFSNDSSTKFAPQQLSFFPFYTKQLINSRLINCPSRYQHLSRINTVTFAVQPLPLPNWR